MDALQISTATVVVLVLVAFAAGWVDEPCSAEVSSSSAPPASSMGGAGS